MFLLDKTKSTDSAATDGPADMSTETHETGWVKCSKSQQTEPMDVQTVGQSMPIGPALIL